MSRTAVRKHRTKLTARASLAQEPQPLDTRNVGAQAEAQSTASAPSTQRVQAAMESKRANKRYAETQSQALPDPIPPMAGPTGKGCATKAATDAHVPLANGTSDTSSTQRTAPSKPKPHAPLCMSYLKGRCRLSPCPRRHPENLRPCKNFARGTCKNKNCPRPHILPSDTPKEPLHPDDETDADTDAASIIAAVSDTDYGDADSVISSELSDDKDGQTCPPDAKSQKRDEICLNFQQGRCRYGRRCRRRHDPPTAVKTATGIISAESHLNAKKLDGGKKSQEERAATRSTVESILPVQPSSVPETDASPRLATATRPPATRAPFQVEDCRDNLRGRCRRGENCAYLHTKDLLSAAPDAPAARVLPGPTSDVPANGATGLSETMPIGPSSPPMKGEKMPCYSFMKQNGSCQWGNGCRNLHPPFYEWKKYLGQSDEICKRFLRGQCLLGEFCWRQHPAEEASEERQEECSVTSNPLTDSNGQTRRGVPSGQQSMSPPPAVDAEPPRLQQKSTGLSRLVIPENVAPGGGPTTVSTSPETSPLLTDDAPSRPDRPVCWDFQKGCCNRLHCKFAHSLQASEKARGPALTAASSWSSTDANRQGPRGLPDQRSIEGKLNRLLDTHSAPDGRPPSVQQLTDPNTKDSEPVFRVRPTRPIPMYPPGLGVERQMAAVHPRPSKPPLESMTIPVFDAVHVTFGPGLAVQYLKTGFESRVVIIKGFPSNKAADDITRLLTPFGDVSQVQLPEVREGPTMLVKATLSTYDEAAKAVAGLDNKSVYGATLRVLLASQHSTSVGKGSVQDSDVCVSFGAPHRVAYLGYTSREAAEQAIALVNATEMGDCQLYATLHQGLPSIATFNIKVVGLPPSAKESDLEQFSSAVRPMMDRPNYLSLDDALHELYRTARQHGELVKITVRAPPFARQRVVAWIHYVAPRSAERACGYLNGKQFTFLGRETLHATRSLTINYTLPKDVFTAIRSDIISLRNSFVYDGVPAYISWFEKQAQFGNGRTVGIKLVADKFSAITSAKVSFDAILRGEQLKMDGHNVWDPFFERAAGAQYLEQLQQEYRGVLVDRNPQRCQIALFGSPAVRKAVRAAILRKVDHLRTQEFHRFPLDGKLIGLFVNADLIKLQQELGHENVVLDFATQSLKIRGNEDALRVVRLILRHVQDRHILQRKHHGQSCPVCFGDVSVPVTLPCGHSWCKSCLEGYLQAVVDTRVFPVACLGDEGRCGTPVPIHVAKEILPMEKFREVTRASFLSYVHSRPSEFFYCPTPDCPQVYRSAPPGIVLQCPSCLIRICGNCHIESHEGTTCAQRDAKDRRLFQQWSSNRDVKNCPGCKIPIERISGCNHVTCTNCKTHICWVCLSTFKNSGEVYEHMHSEHGGIGLEEYWY